MMTIRVFPDYNSLCRGVADLIGAHIAKNPSSMICLASGHTPLGVFIALAADVTAGRLQLGKCRFVSLDEWIGVPPENPGSCRAMMKDFFAGARIRDEQIHFFNGVSPDPESEANKMNELISSYGGLDVMLVGIGLNGHIAMNEPGTSFYRHAHVSKLSPQTIEVGQKYFSGETSLSRGITLGLRHFSDAKLPILMANGEKKAGIIRLSIHGPFTEQVPATVVQKIPHAVVMLDQTAASAMPRVQL